jgi:coniferyl-aldehyde dehydrogenase
MTHLLARLRIRALGVVAPDFPLATAAQRIIWAKCMNAGQVCVNVDYLFLPEGSTDARSSPMQSGSSPNDIPI